MTEESLAPDEPRPNRKHINQIKVRLDDEFEDLLTCAAKIHGTSKSALAREVLKSWLGDVVANSKADSRVA